MTNKAWGYLLLCGAAIWFMAKRTVNAIQVKFDRLRIQSITAESITFGITVLFHNPLITNVTLDRFYGDIYIMGNYVGHLDSPLEQVLLKSATSGLMFTFEATLTQLGQALFESIMTGDIRTLTINFDGAVQVSGIAVPVRKTFTYQDLF